jgi:hypothetical protein
VSGRVRVRDSRIASIAALQQLQLTRPRQFEAASAEHRGEASGPVRCGCRAPLSRRVQQRIKASIASIAYHFRTHSLDHSRRRPEPQQKDKTPVARRFGATDSSGAFVGIQSNCTCEALHAKF